MRATPPAIGLDARAAIAVASRAWLTGRAWLARLACMLGLVGPVGAAGLMGVNAGCGGGGRDAAARITRPSRPGEGPPVCPRDARRDERGRCACVAGTLQALGACVPPAVGDSFCGRAEHLGADGCSFRGCDAGDVLDVATGACTPRLALPFAMPARDCADGGAPLVEEGRPACVPREAACPRGTFRATGGAAAAGGQACARPPTCPPGTLAEAHAGQGARVWNGCRPIVTGGAAGRGGEGPRVDVGAWAALAWGIDGGIASEELCRPLAQRPAAFGVAPGQRLTLHIALRLEIPDQDLTRARASVRVSGSGVETREPGADADAGSDAGSDAGAGSGASAATATVNRILPPGAEVVVESAVAGLVEPLRSLGGHASSAAVEVEVRCDVASL
jgi:hypothetical protein